MQKSVKQIKQQLQIKRSAKKEIYLMKSMLKEQAGEKVKEAFLDVFRALRLAAMDISNSLRLVIGLIFTFDSEKIREKIKDFDTRRQKINAEWEPILQRAKEAFNNADPILTMAVMGPANFLAMQGIGVGLTAGKTATEILAATNWNELVNSFTTTLDVNRSLQQFFQEYAGNESRRAEREAATLAALRTGRGTGVLRNLSSIFSEGSEYHAPLLREQVENQQLTQDQQFTEEQAIDIFIKITGMDKGFEKVRKANLENLTNAVNSIRADIEPMRASSQLFAANDVGSFKKAFDSAKAANPKIDIKSFDKFINTIGVETEKLIKDPKFLEDLKKKNPQAAADPNQIRILAEKTVFQITKKEFDKQLVDGLAKAVKACDEAIAKLKIDDKVLKYMKESPYQDSKNAAKVYEDFYAIYKEIKNDFESKAKPKVSA